MSIGLADYNLVHANFNLSPATYAQGSFDYSGSVDLSDYEGVLANFNATLTAPPTTPGALSISNDGTSPQTALDVDWSAPTPPAGLTITSYKLERSSDGETFSTIPQTGGIDPNNIPAGSTSYQDASLSAGNRYWYRIRALYSDGSTSVYSAKQALNTILAAPTAVVSHDGKSIVLTSQSASQLNSSTLTYTWAATTPSGATAPIYTDNGTAAAIATTATIGAIGNYNFQVTITTPGGIVVSVASVPVTVNPVPALTISPATVTLAAGASQPFAVSGVDQFGNSFDTSAAAWSVAGTDRGTVSPSGTYTAPSDNAGSFLVTAAEGASSVTATVDVSAPAIAGPLAIVEGTAYPLTLPTLGGGSQWTIDWGDGTTPQTVAGNRSTVDLVFATGVASSVITASVLDGGQSFPAPNSISVGIAPASPSGLTATINDAGNVALAWTNNSSIETGFQIYRSTDGINFSLNGTAVATDQTVDVAPAPGFFYIYRVEALDAAGSSAPSNQAILPYWQTNGEASVSGNTVTVGVPGGQVYGDTQPEGVHGASILLPANPQYTVAFDNDLSTWDSYDPPDAGYPDDGTGYFDSFPSASPPSPIGTCP